MKETTETNKICKPSSPVIVGKFTEQDDFFIQMIKFLNSYGGETCGIIYCGYGGGYFVEADEESFITHKPSKIAYIIRPKKLPENAAEYLEREWSITEEDSRLIISDIEEGGDDYEPYIGYLFENKEELEEFLSENIDFLEN